MGQAHRVRKTCSIFLVTVRYIHHDHLQEEQKQWRAPDKRVAPAQHREGNSSIVIWRSLSFVVSFHRFICRWRRSCPVISPFLRSRAPAALRRPAAPPPIPILSIPILVTVVLVPVTLALAATVSVVTPTRTTRPLPVAARRRRRRPPVVAPDRGRGILGPLERGNGEIYALRDNLGSSYLDAQARPFKAPPVPNRAMSGVLSDCSESRTCRSRHPPRLAGSGIRQRRNCERVRWAR